MRILARISLRRLTLARQSDSNLNDNLNNSPLLRQSVAPPQHNNYNALLDSISSNTDGSSLWVSLLLSISPAVSPRPIDLIHSGGEY